MHQFILLLLLLLLFHFELAIEKEEMKMKLNVISAIRDISMTNNDIFLRQLRALSSFTEICEWATKNAVALFTIRSNTFTVIPRFSIKRRKE